ncbi:MAG: hypothetical protein FWF31_05835 [Desulfobulbus sp.]|nr:hypothetical protein [Desulfobulbus sp.]
MEFFGVKKSHNRLRFIDKSSRRPHGHFHKNSFISGDYEIGVASLQAQKTDRAQLQTSLRSVMFDPGKYSKTHRPRQQTAAHGFFYVAWLSAMVRPP